MRYGVGLPIEIPGVTGPDVIEWAKRIDAGPYSTIAVTDVIVSDGFESLTTLAAAASVTSRVRLMTGVVAGPTHNTALLAKQAATIDALSGGRLSLGLGAGELVDDFAVTGTALRGRGRRFDQQIAEMQRIWNGEPAGESGRGIGPSPVQPGGPELLIGGFAERALVRIGQFADGYVGAVLSEEFITDEPFRVVLGSWNEHGRTGRPRFVHNVYFALGDDAIDNRETFLRHAYQGAPEYDLQAIASTIPVSEHGVQQMANRMAGIGVDELIFHPVSAEIDQIERLANALH